MQPQRFIVPTLRLGATALLAALLAVGLISAPGQPVQRAWAAFNPSPQAWTAAFELDPTATDPVSQGDDHLRQIKGEVRNRVETEMDFAELGNVTTDTGRLLEGAGRAFVQAAAPTVDGTIAANCLAEADYDGNRGCDEGRLWLDSDDNVLYVAEDTGADGDADVWTPATAQPPLLTASRAVVTDGSGVHAAATTTATEIGYVNGVTSAIQTQLDGKGPKPTVAVKFGGDQNITAATVTDITELTGLTLPNTTAVSGKFFEVGVSLSILDTSAAANNVTIGVFSGANGNKTETLERNITVTVPASGRVALSAKMSYTPNADASIKYGLAIISAGNCTITASGTTFGEVQVAEVLF